MADEQQKQDAAPEQDQGDEKAKAPEQDQGGKKAKAPEQDQGGKKAKAPKQDQGGKKAKAPKQDRGGKKGKKKGGDKAQAKGDKKKQEVEIAQPVPQDYRPRLLRLYRDEIRPALIQKFGYTSPMEVPRLEKIVVNMGVGEAQEDVKELEDAMQELGQITGQKPRINRARRSIAQFKVRQGAPVGCSVTLRGWRMYDFLDRLVNVAIPRVRDFRGLSRHSFDGRGNHSLGLTEQLIFTEIDYNKVSRTRGMDVTTVTTAKTDAECAELLTLFGVPFRRN